MPIAEINGVNINYEVLGERGPFIALSPGGRREMGNVRTLADRLARAGYRVLIHDRRNCGASDVAFDGNRSEYEIWADDLHVLLTQLNGLPAVLSGVVSNHAANEQVTIYYKPYPQPNAIQRATVLTSTGGTFSFIVAPQIATSYQAAWKGAYATPTSVQVQPKLTLGRNNGWIIHAAAGVRFAGRAVQLQRLNRLTGQWVTLRKVLLNAKSSARVLLNPQPRPLPRASPG